MQHNTSIIDLIVYMAREIQQGTSVDNITVGDDVSHKYNKSEISAAYSFIYEHMVADDEAPVKAPSPKGSVRILHLAERIIISKEAYGYLLELNNLGVLSVTDMEQVIEEIMLQASHRISLEEMKQKVAAYLLKSDNSILGINPNLSGDETIN